MLVYCVVCEPEVPFFFWLVAGWAAVAMLCEAGVTTAYFGVPACEAWTMQVPAIISVTVVPETEHTAGVEEAKLTGRPEVALALSVTDPPATCAAIVSNVMVCCCGACCCWAVRSDTVKHACKPIAAATSFIIVK